MGAAEVQLYRGERAIDAAAADPARYLDCKP